MTEKERMLSNKLYVANNPELGLMHEKSFRLQHEYNNTLDLNRLKEIREELFGSIGKNCYIQPPLRVDYGANTYIGDNFYANFDLIILDVSKVTIGNNVLIGPRVSIYTAGHPIDKDVRNSALEYGYDVKIGNDVWIGGNTVINPGVTIGDNVVIGSGSVVTKDIPSGVIAVGNPCRVLRKINEEDKKYWEGLAREYYEDKGSDK